MAKTKGSQAFLELVNHRLKFSFYLLRKVPAAYFSGVRLVETTETHCIASVPFRWLTANPFRSMYFASMSMAAELTTGILAAAATWEGPRVSMLITAMEGKFFKKAAGTVLFTCADGRAMKEMVDKAILSREPQQFTARSTGRTGSNEVVSEFLFTWSFKVKE
jgi:hypothetical protein